MRGMRKKVYAAAGYTTMFFGPGRPEFDPQKSFPPFEDYLKETAAGTMAQVGHAGVGIDEGIIASFMSGRFLHQANLPGFLPFMLSQLQGQPCTAVEGACGSGGRAIAIAARSILAESADVVFVAGFEMQNSMKSVYGADVLAGAGYYNQQRKAGAAHFFPGLFSQRAGAYYSAYGYDSTRHALAKWYEQAIAHARKFPKAQEYHNKSADLMALGMTKPDAERFVPHLNLYDCSKVSDGAASLLILSEEGLKRCGIEKQQAVELVAIGEAQADITQPPEDLTELATTRAAAQQALQAASLTIKDLSLLELHDCFSITALLSLEAIGAAAKGRGADYISQGSAGVSGVLPTNISGGLCGFGHPTGASGIRQLVDLQQQLGGLAPFAIYTPKPFGMLISMGGDDKTVTCVIVKAGHA